MLRRLVRFKQLGDEAAETEATVVAGEMNVGAGGAEVVDASRQVGRADTVIERNLFRSLPRGAPAVAAGSQQLARIGQKRRLADAAGDQGDVFHRIQLRKAV